MKTLDDVVNKIHCMDVLDGLRDIPDDCVALTASSPPYNVKIKYGDHEDNMPYQEYLDWLKDVFSEVYRVTKDGGRIAINIDAMTNRQEDKDQEYIRAIYAHLYNLMKEIGWKFRTEICWYKQNAVGRKTAWGCYDDNTRVLTDRGFKFFKDVDIYVDRFATLNLITNKVEYQSASAYIGEQYSGDMYSLKSKDFDLLVTPNHNMLLFNHYKKVNYLRKMENCPGSFAIPQNTLGNYSGLDKEFFILPTVKYRKRTKSSYIRGRQRIRMDDWLKFLGIFFTDGNVDYNEKRRCYKASIYQSKDDFLEEIKLLLKRLPFDFKYKDSKQEFYTCDKRLASWLQGYSTKNNRKIPNFILELSQRQKKLFIDWLFKGDGSGGNKGEYLAVASNDFAYKLAKLFVDCGIIFSLRKKKKPKERVYNGNLMRSNVELNIFNIKKSNNYWLSKSEGHISKNNYNGMVYCVEVPNHTLFVERNGCCTWCGNSYKSPSNPIIRRNHEYILVWSKGNWKLEGDKDLIDITAEEFQQWTLSTWFVQPETRNMGGHPVPFPVKLVRRVLKLFSYKNDVILDPFNGSGTTTYVANMLNRKYIGIDNSLEYCDFARNRIQASGDLFEDE